MIHHTRADLKETGLTNYWELLGLVEMPWAVLVSQFALHIRRCQGAEQYQRYRPWTVQVQAGLRWTDFSRPSHVRIAWTRQCKSPGYRVFRHLQSWPETCCNSVERC